VTARRTLTALAMSLPQLSPGCRGVNEQEVVDAADARAYAALTGADPSSAS